MRKVRIAVLRQQRIEIGIRRRGAGPQGSGRGSLRLARAEREHAAHQLPARCILVAVGARTRGRPEFDHAAIGKGAWWRSVLSRMVP